MAQALLLKTDVMTTTSSSQKGIQGQPQDASESKLQSFSSALDKQVSQQDTQHIKADKKEAKVVMSNDEQAQKAGASVDKSGNALPDKNTEIAEKVDIINESELTIEDAELTANTDLSLAPPMENARLELNTDASKVNSLLEEQQGQALVELDNQGSIAVSIEPVVKDTKATFSNNPAEETSDVVIAQNSKPLISSAVAKEKPFELIQQEDGDITQKQQATSLRSDILNVLLKKPSSESEKVTLVIAQKVATHPTEQKITIPSTEQKITTHSIEQKLMAGTTLTPIIKEGLSEEQQMMALANTVKSKGLAAASGMVERSVGVPAATFTPATIVTNGALSTIVTAAQPTLDLQPSLKSEAWGRVLSSRVIWMAREGVQQASLKLNPANMGPVEVKLHMHNEQANISFIAQHAATRDALEQALPRLRESFQDNGIELAHADVSQQDFSQTDEQEDDKATANSSSLTNTDSDDGDPNGEAEQRNEQDTELGLSVFA